MDFFLKAFLTLFLVMDPVGLVPFFLALAGNRTKERQVAIARKAVVVAGLVIAFFFFFGAWFLGHLGIRLEALRIAGGILLFRIAMGMVFAQLERETEEERAEADLKEDISVFPLAVPLIAGPGAMASVLVLAGEAEKTPEGALIVLLAAYSVLFLAYLFLRGAVLIRGALGRTGVNVVTRILGVMLAALAVEYVADGIQGLLGL